MLAKWHEPPQEPEAVLNAAKQSKDIEDRLTANWEAQRGDQVWPTRHDFDPVAIVDLLPYIAIVEVNRADADFTYRLTGTELDRHMGRSLTGLGMRGIPYQGEGSPLWDVLQNVVKDGMVQTATLPFVGSSFDLREIRVIALPYTVEGKAVDQIVLGFTFVSSGLV